MLYIMQLACIVDRITALKCACPHMPIGVLYAAYVILICAML